MSQYKPYPAYKDLGTQWLCSIPIHWNTSSLKWKTKRFAGGTPDKTNLEYWENGTIPWLASGEVNQKFVVQPTTYITEDAYKNSSAKWIPSGSLVMALAGQGKTRGTVAQLSIDSTCNQSMAAIVPIDINNRFLYWWLDSNYSNLRGLSGDDVRDGLNLEVLGQITCPLPTVEEQKVISDYLDRETTRIDALVAKKTRFIELLREKRQALITHAVTKGLDPNVKMKYSGVEWLGEVPEHWDVGPYKALIQIENGADYKNFETDEGYPVIGSGGAFAYTSQKMYEGESVLLGRKGTIDKPLYVNGAFWTVDTMYWSVIRGGACGRFAYYVATTIPFDMYSTNTALPSMTKSVLGAHKTAFPELVEQKAIAAHLDRETTRIDTLTAKTTRSIELLKERRSALITAAVTGQIDLREAA